MPLIEHPLFKPPADSNCAIWRYLDFTKYCSLLNNASLFFSAVNSLEDPFEGSYPKLDFVDVRDLKEKRARFRDYIAVNCWHENEGESAAMWNLYLKSNEGVAIRSTFESLRGSIDTDKDVLVGKVRYLDYDTERLNHKLNWLGPYLCKRNEFEHESEVRAVIHKITEFNSKEPGFVGGVNVSVNLDCLIKEVIVSPTSPPWFRKLVIDVTKLYGYDFQVSESKMTDTPIF